jgi:microcystin-dependent protein
MPLTNTWDRTHPADSDPIAQGADAIRDFKIDVEDRWGFPVDRWNTLSEAVLSISSTECTLVMTQSASLDQDLTIPANIKLKFIPETYITIVSPKVLTINSDNIECGDWACFGGTGTINLKAGSYARSTWFTSIAAAVAAMAAGGTLEIPAIENDTAAAYGPANLNILDRRSPYEVGDIKMSGRSTAQTGWLLCDGSAVSRTTYARLFATVSTTFGVGDGSTTFNVPDCRGRAPIAAGQGSGLTSRALGATVGAETHALSEAELATHTHGASTNSTGAHTHTVSGVVSGSANSSGGGVDGGTATTSSNGAHSHTVTVNNAGSGTAHNNMQPSIALNFFIKF